jgi:large subunit ribosomal protein L43
MSNSHLFLKSGFPRAPLQNGLGRYVCQLQRVTIKFCKEHGASAGVRDFIENDLLDFANNYPGVVVR